MQADITYLIAIWLKRSGDAGTRRPAAPTNACETPALAELNLRCQGVETSLESNGFPIPPRKSRHRLVKVAMLHVTSARPIANRPHDLSLNTGFSQGR